MKKQFILGITALALLAGAGATTLVSCQPDYPAVTIELNRNTIQAEVGGSYTLRATVNSSESINNFMSNFTTDNPEVIEFTTTTSGATNVSFTAKAMGTATITATSVVNPDISASCTVTVGEALPTLPEVFSAINKTHNYTLTATIDGVYAGESGDPVVAHDYTVLTDEAIIQYTDIGGEDAAIWTSKDGNSLYGIGVDTDGYAGYIQYSKSGFVNSPERIISSEGGFLTSENFDGAGLSSPTSGDLFISLSAINPSYYPSEKSNNNIYEIVGSNADSELNSVYVEVGLLNAFAPDVYQSLVQQVVGSDGMYSLLDVVGLYDTSIEVLGTTNFKVTFTIGDATVVGTIDKLGTTALSDISTMLPTLETDLSTFTTVVPELNSELEAAADGFEGNNYVQKIYSFFKISEGEYAESSYNCYFAGNYVFLYYDETFVNDYNKYKDPTAEELTVGGTGLYYKDDTIILFETDGSSVTDAVVAGTGDGTKLSDYDLYTATKGMFTNYFTATAAYSEDRSFFYQFTPEASGLWQGDDTEYHIAQADLTNLIAQQLVWGEPINTEFPTGESLLGMNVVLSAGSLSEVNFSFGWPTGNGYYSTSKATFTNFGKAEAANPLNDAIETFFSTYNPSEQPEA